MMWLWGRGAWTAPARAAGLLPAAILLLTACSGGSGRPRPPPVVVDTLRLVEGRIRYFRRGPAISTDATGRAVSGPVVEGTVPVAVRGVPVAIHSPGGRFLGGTVTQGDGTYSFTVNFGRGAPATPVVVQVQSRIGFPFGTFLRVLPTPGALDTYTVETPPSGDPNARSLVVDLDITFADGAGAFNICNVLFDSFFTAKAAITGALPDMDVFWEEGNGARSRFFPVGSKAEITIAGGTPGDDSSNRDEFDDPVIARIFGEFLFAFVTHDVAPSGMVNDALLVPSVAWREGLLDAWSCISRNDSRFWDTEGVGAQGHLVTYFDIESFFDPALGTLGPGDPNVYQPASTVGVASRFTVAEVLWDLHDFGAGTDSDPLNLPLNQTIDALELLQPGQTYPYLISLFDAYHALGIVAPGLLQQLLLVPEDQGILLPATDANGEKWPRRFPNAASPGNPITAPYDLTIADRVDVVNPVPLNREVGFLSQRYFLFVKGDTSNITLTLTTAGNLSMEVLNLNNVVLASGTGAISMPGLVPGAFVVRVLPDTSFEDTTFDLRLELN